MTTTLPGSGENGAAASESSGSRRELLYGLGGLVLFILASLVLMVGMSSAREGASFGEAIRALVGPGQALDLTIVHTNDTWGYLEACG